MRQLVNPFELPGKWYKANLHTHTTTSDGAASISERVLQYRDAGYDVLAITDHGCSNDVRSLSNKKMLVISGMEYHPQCDASPIKYHIVALNIPQGFTFADKDNARCCIDQVRKVGGENFLAHPYWSRHTYMEIKELVDKFVAMEIYNSTCDRHGQADSENEWSYCLDKGYILPIIGCDDVHCAEGEDLFESWTWLKMTSLNAANVLAALRRGACYVSCGPQIRDFRIKDERVTLNCSAVQKIYFIGGPGLGSRRRAERSKSIKTYTIDIPNWSYVRAVIVDAMGRRAWTNPIFI